LIVWSSILRMCQQQTRKSVKKTTGLTSDRRRGRKLARGLKNGDFKPIFVPGLEQQQDRSLLRTYDKIVRDTTRVKNRIKLFLAFFGISIPDELQGKNWTKEFINWLEKANPGGYGNLSLQILLGEYKMLAGQTALLKKQIRELSEQSRYKTHAGLLKSIPGVGTLTSMILLTEIGDINRFLGLNELSAYFGLIPNCHDSGETKWVGRNTRRGNVYLKYILVEAAWMSIRHDSSLLLAYKSAVRKMDSNKAIIKVARKLLNRIRFVLKNNKPYQVNMARSKK
jgi:transposase